MLSWAAFLLIGAAPAADAASSAAMAELPMVVVLPVPGHAGNDYWQMVIQQRMIIRVPARRTPINNFGAEPRVKLVPRERPVVWKEKKAPKCVPMRNILGMQATQRDSIDLITRQRQRLRARLNDGCRALDFYAGFYMEGNKDGRLCEGRDQLHARTGAKCEVDKFRLLVPVPVEDD